MFVRMSRPVVTFWMSNLEQLNLIRCICTPLDLKKTKKTSNFMSMLIVPNTCRMSTTHFDAIWKKSWIVIKVQLDVQIPYYFQVIQYITVSWCFAALLDFLSIHFTFTTILPFFWLLFFYERLMLTHMICENLLLNCWNVLYNPVN